MIRRCTDTDIAAIDAIINEAAQAHRGVIPADVSLRQRNKIFTPTLRCSVRLSGSRRRQGQKASQAAQRSGLSWTVRAAF